MAHITWVSHIQVPNRDAPRRPPAEASVDDESDEEIKEPKGVQVLPILELLSGF